MPSCEKKSKDKRRNTVSFDNYRGVLTSESLHFLEYLKNSALISAVSALCAVVIASLGAYTFIRLSLPGKTGILFFILAVSMFPQISVVSYLFKFMTQLGWINTYRALILPYIFLLDEPLSNLDAQLRVSIRAELKNLQRMLGITILYVTHDQREAMSLGDKVTVLNEGNIEQIGTL